MTQVWWSGFLTGVILGWPFGCYLVIGGYILSATFDEKCRVSRGHLVVRFLLAPYLLSYYLLYGRMPF